MPFGKTRDKSTSSRFNPNLPALKMISVMYRQFRELWGLADDVHEWDIESMKEKNKNGVCQSVGLDMLGAAIKTLK